MTKEYTAEPTRQRRKGERGLALIESLIGLLVLTIVLVAFGQLFRIHVEHLALAERARQADTQANALLNDLAARNRSELRDANPFSGKGPAGGFAPGEQVTLDDTVCQAGNCDLIARIQQVGSTSATDVTLAWNYGPAPANSTIIYRRAWRVTTIDAAKGLRRITVAILPPPPEQDATSAVEPLTLRQTDVVQRQ